jgi:hypothetical protein
MVAPLPLSPMMATGGSNCVNMHDNIIGAAGATFAVPLFMGSGSDAASSSTGGNNKRRKHQQPISAQKAQRSSPLTHKVNPRPTSMQGKIQGNTKIVSAKTVPVMSALQQQSFQQSQTQQPLAQQAGFDADAVAIKGKQEEYTFVSADAIQKLLQDFGGSTEGDDNSTGSSEAATGKVTLSDATRNKIVQAVKTQTVAVAADTNKVNGSKFVVSSSDMTASLSTTKNSLDIDDPSRNLVKSTRVRASVQETGSDTLKSYIKTMANHDLLRQEDEVILGDEIQIQVKWEAIRVSLEETLLR